MFEPAIEKLQALFKHHGDKLDNRMAGIEHHLQVLVQDTNSNIASDEYGDLSDLTETGEGEVAEITFETVEGFAWEVRQVAVSGGSTEEEEKETPGTVAVYIGDIAPQNLIDVMKTPLSASRARYYVPPRSALIFHFYEQPEKQACVAHVQVKRLLLRPETLATTGTNQERTDRLHEVPKIPDGHPLRDPDGAPMPGHPDYPFHPIEGTLGEEVRTAPGAHP